MALPRPPGAPEKDRPRELLTPRRSSDRCYFSCLYQGRKRHKQKEATNLAATTPIRAIICAQKAVCLGYILGRLGLRGRPKMAQTRVQQISKISIENYFMFQYFFRP